MLRVWMTSRAALWLRMSSISRGVRRAFTTMGHAPITVQAK